MRCSLLMCLGFCFLTQLCLAQTDWTQKSNKDGISVYTKTVATSGLKGIRVKCSLPATLSQVTALIMDVDAGIEWVYATKSSKLLERVSSSELYYYSEVEVPWPLSNRDFISHLKVNQNAKSKVVTIIGPTEPNFIPVKKDIVRVNHSYGKWELTPSKNNVNIEYTLEVDPGGSIPVWLVNLFATSGPTQTFKKMKVQVQKPKYANAKFNFIENN